MFEQRSDSQNSSDPYWCSVIKLRRRKQPNELTDDRFRRRLFRDNGLVPGRRRSLSDRLIAGSKPHTHARSAASTEIVGLNIEVVGLEAAIGDGIVVRRDRRFQARCAEVIAIKDGGFVCMPFGDLAGVRSGSPAEATDKPMGIHVGDELLGRVVDGLGNPIDNGPSLSPECSERPVDGTPPHPLWRSSVEQQLPLGVRVIDTLIPCGRGQRLGIFAGSGVGKSTLLSMIARGTEAARIGDRTDRRTWS